MDVAKRMAIWTSALFAFVELVMDKASNRLFSQRWVFPVALVISAALLDFCGGPGLLKATPLIDFAPRCTARVSTIDGNREQ